MKLEQSDLSLLFSSTNLPDIFFTEYLSQISGDALKVYLYMTFLAKYNKDIRLNDLSKKLELPLKTIQDSIKYLEEQTLSVSNFRKVTTLVGGEGQNIVFDKNLAAKYGYEIEGYYESDDTNNISYDKINNLSIFPYVEDGNLTEINVFIRYIKNN